MVKLFSFFSSALLLGVFITKVGAIDDMALDFECYSNASNQWISASTADWDSEDEELGFVMKGDAKRDAEQRELTIRLLKDCGVLDKYTQQDELDGLCDSISNLGDRAAEITGWLLTSGALGKCQYWYQVSALIASYEEYNSKIFSYLFTIPGLMNKDILKQLLSIYVKEEVNGVLALLAKDKPLPVNLDWMPLYFAVWGSSLDQGRVNQVIENAIETRPADCTEILFTMVKMWGEKDPKTQQYIRFAVHCDHRDIPDSFLVVSQEMIRKRQESVVHNPQSAAIHGLNVDVVRESRPIFSIHMPINTWENLFLLLGQNLDWISEVDPNFVGVSIDDLLSLKTAPMLCNLLDPKDSLRPRKNISSYSHMFRAVLRNIQLHVSMNDRRLVFAQLLNNILHYPAGNLNGVLESYKQVAQTIGLNQRVENFPREITLNVKEELCHAKEASLESLIYGLGLEEVSSSDLHYLRSIIGDEIGLILEGEEPFIDMGADIVSPELRQRSKQELLDLFYNYYTVECVVEWIQDMLNESVKDRVSVILAILDKYLPGDNAEFIKTDKNGNPIGFTQAAVTKFLELMGILE